MSGISCACREWKSLAAVRKSSSSASRRTQQDGMPLSKPALANREPFAIRGLLGYALRQGLPSNVCRARKFDHHSYALVRTFVLLFALCKPLENRLPQRSALV